MGTFLSISLNHVLVWASHRNLKNRPRQGHDREMESLPFQESLSRPYYKEPLAWTVRFLDPEGFLDLSFSLSFRRQ